MDIVYLRIASVKFSLKTPILESAKVETEGGEAYRNIISQLSQESCDKAKPFERGGQKATGLISKMAELPTD